MYQNSPSCISQIVKTPCLVKHVLRVRMGHAFQKIGSVINMRIVQMAVTRKGAFETFWRS